MTAPRGRRGKDVWHSHLPAWRDQAVGVEASNTVYVVTVLRHDPTRLVRLVVPADHARALADDLITAADKAERTPAQLQSTTEPGDQIDLLDDLLQHRRTA